MAKKVKNGKLPRKAKKALKRKYGLEGQKVSKVELTQLANKEAAKKRRRNADARRYNENKALLRSAGLPESIITKRTSKKETQRLVDEYLQQQKRDQKRLVLQQRYATKVNRLIDAGFTQQEAQQIVGSISHQISYDKLESIIAEKNKPKINDNIKLSSDVWLYVGYKETNEDLSFREYANYSVEEMLDLIRARVNEFQFNPTGSADMTAVFVVESGPRSLMEEVANDYYMRKPQLDNRKGYVKFDNVRYYKMTLNNTYSYHKFLELVCTVLCNCKNEMVIPHLNSFKEFCSEAKFPFLDEL